MKNKYFQCLGKIPHTHSSGFLVLVGLIKIFKGNLQSLTDRDKYWYTKVVTLDPNLDLESNARGQIVYSRVHSGKTILASNTDKLK